MSLYISENLELKNELEAYISKHFEGKISLKTTLTELEKILDRKSIIKKEIEKRISIAPDKFKVLNLIIQDYREQTIAHIKYIGEGGYPECYDYEVYVATHLHDIDGYAPEGMARHLIEKGLDFELIHFSNLLTIKYDQSKSKNGKKFGLTWNIEYIIQDLADGVALAFLLPELENELQELREPKNQIQIEPETFEDTKNSGGTLKQKILVLKELGFFGLPKYETIQNQKGQKGQIELLNFLTGQSRDNIKKALQVVASNEFAMEKKNLEVVNNLFETIGLDKIDNLPKKKGYTPRN